MADPEAAPRRCVIGIGNADRGDDALGLLVARRLRSKKIADLEIAEASGEATSLLDRFEGADSVYIVDAALFGAAPGTIRRFDVAAAPLPPMTAPLSTHGLGLAEAIELARALKRLPACLIVYAVELGDCSAGEPLTLAVAAAVDAVIALLCAEILGNG